MGCVVLLQVELLEHLVAFLLVVSIERVLSREVPVDHVHDENVQEIIGSQALSTLRHVNELEDMSLHYFQARVEVSEAEEVWVVVPADTPLHVFFCLIIMSARSFMFEEPDEGACQCFQLCFEGGDDGLAHSLPFVGFLRIVDVAHDLVDVFEQVLLIWVWSCDEERSIHFGQVEAIVRYAEESIFSLLDDLSVYVSVVAFLLEDRVEHLQRIVVPDFC